MAPYIKIATNTKLIQAHRNLELKLPEIAQPRILLTQILSEINLPDETIFIKISTAGKRIITQPEEKLISGRRVRTYYAIKHKNKITIKFAWYKIKRLSKEELEFCTQNWHMDFFETVGKKFIKEAGGCVFFENLLYGLH